MMRRDGDEEIGDDDRCDEIDPDDGDLLGRYRAHRADSGAGDAGALSAVSGERMRVNHRLCDDDRRQEQENRQPHESHRSQNTRQFARVG